MRDQATTIIDTLLNDNSYHIEFNGHLTNHNKHAVIALYRLGASADKIKEYYDNYARLTPYGYSLERPKPSKHNITAANWSCYLGMRSSFSAYVIFFTAEAKRLGSKALMEKYFPSLLPGWTGALTHATIHLGWALDIGNEYMVIEALAYMAFSYVSCHVERCNDNNNTNTAGKSNTVIDDLLLIAKAWDENSEEWKEKIESMIADKSIDTKINMHPEVIRSGLQYRIAKMLNHGHPLLYSIPNWLKNNLRSIDEIWQQLHYMSALLYMVNPGDFLILHFITSLHAMENIALYMNEHQQREIIKCYWVGTLSILFSRAYFPSHSELLSLHLKYNTSYDLQNDSSIKTEWQQIIANAIKEEEEHNPKMVYVLRRMWKQSGYRSIFRIAATHFTKTPELPESFNMPPTY